MKKLLPLLLAAMLVLTACGGNNTSGGDTSSADDTASAGQSHQEETGAGSQSQEDQPQPEDPDAGDQSKEPEKATSAEELPEETVSGGQTQPAGQALSAQSLSALEKVTYYGDRSRCAMTREQLVAYAQFALTYDENDIFHEEGRLSYAFLADFDGNGNPYLVFVHPAPGVGDYAPEVYSYVDGRVQIVCSCADGSASGGYLKELKDGRVLYVEWEMIEPTGYYENNVAYHYSQISNGGLVPVDEPGEEDYGGTGASPSLYELCNPGWDGSEICSSTDEATAALLLAVKGNAASDREQVAAAMLQRLFATAPYDSDSDETFLQIRLVDLDQDGVEEMFTLSDMGPAMLYSWQNGALQEKFVGANAGGSLSWYLCRDAETGELGIEYESLGGGDFSGGSRTYYYADDRTVEISDINENYIVDGAAATKARYDAVVARHQRQELLSDGLFPDHDVMQEPVDQLLAILAQ